MTSFSAAAASVTATTTTTTKLLIVVFAATLLSAASPIISATETNHLLRSSPISGEFVVEQQQQQQQSVIGNITIIVGGEEETPVVVSEPPRLLSSSCRESQKTEARFHLNESTKLIYIDSSNESGYLLGEVSANERELRAQPHPRQQQQTDEVNKATNYSVFLVSRHKDHIALLLDIEQLDFEPIINCENQELRLSIVGEISKQLLNKKVNNQTSEQLEESGGSEQESSVEDEAASSSHSAAQADSTPPLPVSEAMSMLLNSPLNKTILDESEDTNDFKIIDSTIDYLHEETCLSLAAKGSLRPSAQRARVGSKSKQRKQHRSRRLRAQPKKQVASYCPQDSNQFKELMVSKLNEYFEWDDFKIVCGKTKQLLIPMRSLKLSVYSDEFSPSSRFIIRYQFISDPKLLPSQDSDKYYCRNRNVIDLALKCNGIDDCGDASDESIKICGYPTTSSRTSLDTNPPATSDSARVSKSLSTQQWPQSDTSAPAPHQPTTNKRRLTYVGGDVLHCCQSAEWLSIIPQAQNNQLNLQSLLGDSMHLFSGPIFAPTSRKQQASKRRHKRIVGGGVAPKGAWPAQVSLQYELLEPLCHFCAGTLIHPQYVLTAGHCITKDGLSRGIKVVLGAHDLRQLDGNHIQVRYVDDAQIYPGVDAKHLTFDWENDMNNDIALLRLNAPVQITPHVAPACLPPFNTPLAVNTTCRSIGWGQTHGSGSSNMLKHLSLKVVESSLCSKELFEKDGDDRGLANRTAARASRHKSRAPASNRARFAGEFEYSSLDQYSDLTMVCVNNDLGHGICQGDSGGPLYCERQTASGERCMEIYGVASFIIQYATVGAMCAVENLPGIFGEVSSKTEWISSTMKMFEQSYRLKYS